MDTDTTELETEDKVKDKNITVSEDTKLIQNDYDVKRTKREIAMMKIWVEEESKNKGKTME